MGGKLPITLFLLAAIGFRLEAQVAARDSIRREPRTILAIGAHAGDMELTAGALLIRQQKLGDRVVILHMTYGTRFCWRHWLEWSPQILHTPV